MIKSALTEVRAFDFWAVIKVYKKIVRIKFYKNAKKNLDFRLFKQLFWFEVHENFPWWFVYTIGKIVKS